MFSPFLVSFQKIKKKTKRKEMENINYTFIILLIHFFLIAKARVDKSINYMSWYNLVFMILSLRLKLKCAIFLAIKLFWM
jgi:hypothetical protein